LHVLAGSKGLGIRVQDLAYDLIKYFLLCATLFLRVRSTLVLASLQESDKAALRSLTLSAVKGEASESTEAKIMEVVSVSTTTTTTTPEFV